jgi:DnaJ-domain-containing protein 1
MNFVFPVTWSSEFDRYIQRNRATVISNLRQLEQRISDLSSDAQQTLTSLRQAEWQLDQAKDAYGDCLLIVTKSGSIALIQALEKIHAYLNTTALTEFLAARRWQDFKEAVAEAIKEMEHLSEVAKDYQDSGTETNGAAISETGMSRERALKILGLKDGCRPAEVKRAWREECKKWNIDQRQNYEPHILEKIQEQFKEVNEAKEVLLGKT